jgi:murein DD-endopeptidase MepM/ murein hydrolase activator NlpD
VGLKGVRRLALACALAASVILSGPVPVSADDVSEARQRLEIINRLKGSLQDNLMKAQAQEIAIQQQLQETRDQISQTIEKIAEIEHRIAQLEREIVALEARIADTRLRLAKAKLELAAFWRAAYKSDANPLAQILASPNFQSFLNRAVAIEHLSHLSDLLISQIRQLEIELTEQMVLVKEKKREADAKRADLIAQKKALEEQQAHELELQEKLRASIARVRWELSVINSQSTALAQQITAMEIARQNQIIAEAEQAAWQQAQFWMQHNLFSLPGATSTHSTKYPLIWPMQKGEITLGFGPCNYPFEPPGFGYPHFHTGVDVAYNQGTPILAADDGVVVAADASRMNGMLVGYGKFVIIAHKNNFFSLYGHLLGYQVKTGDAVHQGQLIGNEGSTGNSTGPHIHFEYRYGGQPTNPLPYLPPNGPNSFSQ